MKNNEQINKELYGIVDSFLVEAKNQYGVERSLERLNADRHLAVENLGALIHSIREADRQAVVEEILEKIGGRNDTEDFIKVKTIIKILDDLLTQLSEMR